ncbi:MAG: FmdE family protein [Treponema sp.]|jgi:formylmethanofuran dehydrogenase subunit E|nr:FmdE family protein [Treponema sp.]
MNQTNWEKAVSFHGHECPGLAIGVRVCDAVVLKMGVKESFDEELVCITENDACGVDAIQALMSCTFGKGNLIFRDTGKHAYTFISRTQGKAMRFYFKVNFEGQDRGQFQRYILDAPVDELFDCREVNTEAPELARKFPSVVCEVCVERAGEHRIHIQQGKKVCLDCFKNYSRVL